MKLGMELLNNETTKQINQPRTSLFHITISTPEKTNTRTSTPHPCRCAFRLRRYADRLSPRAAARIFSFQEETAGTSRSYSQGSFAATPAIVFQHVPRGPRVFSFEEAPAGTSRSHSQGSFGAPIEEYQLHRIHQFIQKTIKTSASWSNHIKYGFYYLQTTAKSTNSPQFN